MSNADIIREDAEYLDNLPPCKNCGESIHEHHRDSEPPWACPYGPWDEPQYGFFCGGDPRLFHPDAECCSLEEIARHKEACRQADLLEKNRNLPCPSGYERLPDGRIVHVLRAPFGIGVYTFPHPCYESGREPDCDGQKMLFDEKAEGKG